MNVECSPGFGQRNANEEGSKDGPETKEDHKGKDDPTYESQLLLDEDAEVGYKNGNLGENQTCVVRPDTRPERFVDLVVALVPELDGVARFWTYLELIWVFCVHSTIYLLDHGD